ncbi:MAG TPA: hypothetical protein VF174_06555 [Micromonosporaceae bacterium]
MAEGSTADRTINRGPGRVLIALYLLFAIAATSRAGFQLITKYQEAPLAYLLSAFAAVIYIVATVGLARANLIGRRVALTACLIELVGVLGVGAASLTVPQAFPDDTVWSRFGEGYGYLPLVLPMIGLVWLRRAGKG